jgi:hypothetical protein
MQSRVASDGLPRNAAGGFVDSGPCQAVCEDVAVPHHRYALTNSSLGGALGPELAFEGGGCLLEGSGVGAG